MRSTANDDKLGGPSFAVRRNRLVRVREESKQGSHGATIVERRGRLVRIGQSEEITDEAPEDAPAIEQSKVSRLSATAITLFVISLMIPASQRFGSIRMTPYLLLLLVGMIPMVILWLSRVRKMPSDFLVLIFCFWASTALILSGGFAMSAQPVGVLFLQTFGAYMAGRVFVRDPASMRLMLRVTVGAIFVTLPLVTLEALTGQKWMLKLGALFGQPLSAVDTGTRLGLHRAQGAFEHPILMGIFCASFMAMAFYAFRDSRYRVMRWLGAPIPIVTGIFSLSTGALLTLNIQFGLMLWSRVFRTMKNRWAVLSTLLAIAYVVVDMLSTKSPFHVFVHYATFSTQSSYNRILIWQFGSAEALRHPWFGIGFADWTRPRYMSNSMDNFWLLEAVRYGIPAFLLLVSSICLLLFRMGKLDYRSEELVLMRRGVTFALIATMVSIISVHLWNASYVWFLFLVGASAWLADPQWAKASAKTPATA